MIPVVQTWARRCDLDAYALVMAMAIATCNGGTLTMLTCGPALAVHDPLEKFFELTLLAQTPLALSWGAAFVVYCVLGTCLLPRGSAPKAGDVELDDVETCR